MSAPSTSPAPATARKTRIDWRRTAIEVLVVLALFFAIRAWQGRALADRPPEGTLVTLDGSTLDPSAPGSPMVVHFFATWCGVCRAEEGNVIALARDHRVTLVASQSGGAAVVRRYLDEHGLGDVPVALDEEGELAERWGISAFPATFYVGGDGGIDFAEIGYTSELGMRLRAFFTR